MKLVVVVLLLTYLSAVWGFGSGIAATVYSLSAQQAENGGFHSRAWEGAVGDLEETESALFLAGLFGAYDKVNIEAVKNYLGSLSTSDNGFSLIPGGSSELEAVRHAVFALGHVGGLPDDPSAIIAHVNSYYDETTGLFRNSQTGSADFVSTASALEIYAVLGYKGSDLLVKKAQIQEKLQSSVKYEEGLSFFSYITSDNYYAILSGVLTGFKFQEPATWIRYFSSRQVLSGGNRGGFFSDNSGQDVTVSDLYFAVRSIFLLKQRLVTQEDINLSAILGYISTIPGGLTPAAQAYGALSSTSAFQEVFKITTTYTVRDIRFKVTPTRIIQGTVLKPNVQVRTGYGLVHPGLTISLEIEHESGVEERQFEFDPESGAYETNEFYDSSDKFGPVSFTYLIQWVVFGREKLVFRLQEEKSIGYDVLVVPSAISEGSPVARNGNVKFDSTFTFDVTLGTVDVPLPGLKNGDFTVGLRVLDSSKIAIHTTSIQGQGNEKPFSFDYTLSNYNIPAGHVTFLFEVSNEDGVHTTEEVLYYLDVPMVATNVQFETDKVIKYNEPLVISMEPATRVNSNLQKYESVNRQFYLDIYTKYNVLMASFPGQLSTNEGDSVSKYIFTVNIQPRYDLVGDVVVSFRYFEAQRKDIKLESEDESIIVKVDAELEVIELQGLPESGVISYGGEISLTFNIKDNRSGSLLYRSSPEGILYLVVRQSEKDGGQFITTKSKVFVDVDKFGEPTNMIANWAVDPNVAKGKAELGLVVLDKSGHETPLYSKGAPWVYDITIGGELKIDTNTFSTQFDQFDTTYLVSFDLTSEENPLNGAELTAKVSLNAGKNSFSAVIPVAGGFDGSYQVSWIVDNRKAKAGDYVVDIYRNVDLARSEKVQPLFSITHYHAGNDVSPLPFKTEFLVLLSLVVASIVISLKKVEIEKANK